jgi:ribosomal protein L11 methyltransferase
MLRTTDWSDEWKRFFHVLRVGRLVIRPSWESVAVAPGELLIDLDPGAAFGTGQHETTRLCLAALDEHLRPGVHVIDVGTGSGILAIAAARLGAASVLALDIDAGAVAVARENVARNGVDAVVTLAAGPLDDHSLAPPASAGSTEPRMRAGLVVANISSQTVIDLLPTIAGSLSPSGLSVLSGFTDATVAAIEAAVRAAGLTPLTTTADGEWRCLVAQKPEA